MSVWVDLDHNLGSRFRFRDLSPVGGGGGGGGGGARGSAALLIPGPTYLQRAVRQQHSKTV